MNYEKIHWLTERINLYMRVRELYDPNLHGSDGAKQLENVKCLQIVILLKLKDIQYP